MNQELVWNFEYTVAHVSDYISEYMIFNLFKPEDIKNILKAATLTPDEFIDLMRQSVPTVKASDLYKYTRNTRISISNLEEVIRVLKTIQKYMKLRYIDAIINIFCQTNEEITSSKAKISNLENQIEKLKSELNKLLNSERVYIYEITNFTK